ncbi:MAG: proline dehydrogenase family protein [Bacteroidetes bacterium]|nr:proline dehydrogenase family protein [Rhodothermia bacterium]MCS7154725.1 proline dehydrogenase family protein [Bacteroidota bacterium]MCX7907118.1 proline dehydrogenase family protein [Bacteroidota bacterium]MDW8137518.1 proline dehydrogenase family protein [Bacteroidota bacterium]MDW8285528.1 proline dehydrogenase family protein [Bacteroidota bacterium]
MRLPFALARRFVAGEQFEEAVPKVRALNARGIGVTLDLLGEYVTDRARAEKAARDYLELLERIQKAQLEATVSIKLSMLGLKIDRDLARAGLFRLLEKAHALGQFITIDMEGSDLTQAILDLFEEAHDRYPENVGTVLQAYLYRTEQDVERMIARGAQIRLCKGAYKEPPSIAYQRMDQIRERFLQYMRRLLEHGRYPAIATHDDRLIAATKAFAQEKGITADRFEFQMLYGIRPQMQVRLVEEGYRMRVYVPFGREWLPYFSRRLRERKENVWFVLTNLFRA